MRIPYVVVATASTAVQRLRGWLAAPLLGLLLLGGMPRRATAGPMMEMCMKAVDGWYADCIHGSGYWLEQWACGWVAGVGYMVCVVIGFIELVVEHMM